MQCDLKFVSWNCSFLAFRLSNVLYSCHRNLCTLHDLETALKREEGVKKFSSLNVGSLLHNPLVKAAFQPHDSLKTIPKV